MVKPAHVAVEQLAQVVHAVFQHRDTVDAHAPCAQHIRMPHAAAENLEPVLALAESDLALVAPALDVDLERRLGEREERGTETHVDMVDLEEGLAELVQDPFEVTEMRPL